MLWNKDILKGYKSAVTVQVYICIASGRGEGQNPI